jgi:hypothetical protein
MKWAVRIIFLAGRTRFFSPSPKAENSPGAQPDLCPMRINQSLFPEQGLPLLLTHRSLSWQVCFLPRRQEKTRNSLICNTPVLEIFLCNECCITNYCRIHEAESFLSS